MEIVQNQLHTFFWLKQCMLDQSLFLIYLGHFKTKSHILSELCPHGNITNMKIYCHQWLLKDIVHAQMHFLSFYSPGKIGWRRRNTGLELEMLIRLSLFWNNITQLSFLLMRRWTVNIVILAEEYVTCIK